MFKKEALIIVLIIVFCGGCSHNLEIKNLDLYQNMNMTSLDKPLTIGIVPSTGDLPCQKFLKAISTELGKHSARVLLPYSEGSQRPVDVKAKIVLSAEYKGSGWNFLINWPGFIIFTPAWHGYNYRNTYNVEILLTKASDNTKIDSFNVPVNLRIRHADMSRTWSNGVGWIEFGITPFISGFVFIGYDDTVTGLVADKIRVPVGNYIAQEIVSRINNFGNLGTTVKEKENTQNTKKPGTDITSMKEKLKQIDEMKESGLINELEHSKLKAKTIEELLK
jgi:hypothetical protein